MDEHPIIITQRDLGKLISLQKGREFHVELDENPSTGYIWEVDRLEGGQVKVIGKAFKAGASQRMGAGGTRVLKLSVEGTGTMALTLKKWRPWLGEPSVVKKVKFSLLFNKI